MKKIIIAIDSFKGCLTSAEAGKAAEKGIKSINPSCHTSVIPIADGGEGLLDVLITEVSAPPPPQPLKGNI